ncbi:MAG: IS30 family transposase [Proteobacteria bacterium]|nr:IS30 family transposase [Pseudomonadota bacterium]MDA0992283.1 IS30 family transposase [Pseudomonadota bacterium]
MKYPTRIYCTEADKSLMGDRWRKGESLNAIGRHFGRSHSSIQNILAQTGGIRPPKRRRSQRTLTMAEREQIAGWLKRRHPNNENPQVSHETIYKSLFIQVRGALKKELQQHLRKTRAMRRSRHKTLKGKGPGQITDAVSIRERPASVADRALPGHWEGDPIFGTYDRQIATLVKRHTRYVMLMKVDSKETETNALIKHSHKLPRELCKSLTWDRGSELADHKRFTLATDIKVCFCDPQSPWQTGSNENTNGLLRQYFPKGTDLSVHSQAKLNAVARQLNERPRKTLQFYSPAEKFNECVATIH